MTRRLFFQPKTLISGQKPLKHEIARVWLKATSAGISLFPWQGTAGKGILDAGYALGVEERGLSLSWSAVRVSYAAGGDGESNIRADLRNLAAFVRDPCTVVSCVLLPFSCSLQMDMQVGLGLRLSKIINEFQQRLFLPQSLANICVLVIGM